MKTRKTVQYTLEFTDTEEWTGIADVNWAFLGFTDIECGEWVNVRDRAGRVHKAQCSGTGPADRFGWEYRLVWLGLDGLPLD